jgi:hypothetical protein
MRYKAPIVMSVVAIMLTASAAALAFSSSDYQKQAAAYTTQHCKPKVLDNIALECYLYAKTQELGASIDSLSQRQTADESTISNQQTSINSLAGKPAPVTVADANGHVLGELLSQSSGDDQIWSPTLHRLFDLDFNVNDGDNYLQVYDPSGPQNVYFTNSDCTGTAYMSFGPGQLQLFNYEVNRVIRGARSTGYYTVDANSPSLPEPGVRSYHSYGTADCSLISTGASPNMLQVTPVTLPFPNPVALPLKFSQ